MCSCNFGCPLHRILQLEVLHVETHLRFLHLLGNFTGAQFGTSEGGPGHTGAACAAGVDNTRNPDASTAPAAAIIDFFICSSPACQLGLTCKSRMRSSGPWNIGHNA